MAGAPFECIDDLATLQTSKLAHNLIQIPGRIVDEAKDSDGRTRMAAMLERELALVRAALWKAGHSILAPYLIFSTGGVRQLLSHLLAAADGEDAEFAHRNSRAGDRERHLLLYLQRIAAKNDTFSRFGPSAWGKVDKSVRAVTMDVQPGIAKQDVFFERWAAHVVAAAINAESNNLTEVAVPALEPHAFDVLYQDVQKWPPGPSREKWLSILQPLAELGAEFAVAKETRLREKISDKARDILGSLTGSPPTATRFLYSASNPLGEECFRETNFTIHDDLINEVVTEAAPWIDLWRDTYAFVASRVAAGLRRVLEKAGVTRSAMPLPAFLQACEAANLSLTGPGLVALSVMAFQEIKAAFRERMRPHLHLTEYELTRDDCHIVRQNFEYPKFDEYTYPSADLQIAAESLDAIARGDYQWILAELHPPVALLHHCMYWACPDKPALNRALASTVASRPNFHFGFFAADFTAHTTVRIFDALPELTNFVAPQRAMPSWRAVSPADAEVYVDAETGDVGVRRIDNREYLGSFARAWVIPLGFHPFQFGMAPKMPRLRCGKVIVQRRAWVVTTEEFPAGNYKGVSRDLVLAVEKLRAQRDLPRFVYIRPTEQALRRSGAEGRDKDTKPVFVDLESYLFLEIFYRWLIKAGELEVTEMLPTPEQLWWKESDGRRTCELRTLIVPGS